jgi:hypothetical protein
MSTLDRFNESLVLIKMGKIKGSNAHVLVVQESRNTFNPKSKQKGKRKSHYEHKKEGNSKPFNDSSGSKGGNEKKGNSKSSYYNRDYHLESSCLKKTIDLMENTL